MQNSAAALQLISEGHSSALIINKEASSVSEHCLLVCCGVPGLSGDTRKCFWLSGVRPRYYGCSVWQASPCSHLSAPTKKNPTTTLTALILLCTHPPVWAILHERYEHQDSSRWLTEGWTHHQVGVKGDFALVLWHLCSDPVWMLRGCLLSPSVWVAASTQALVFMVKWVLGCEVPGRSRGLEPIKACLVLSIGCMWHNQFRQRQKARRKTSQRCLSRGSGEQLVFQAYWNM